MIDWSPCAQHSTSWKDATVPEDECTTFLRSVGFNPTPKQYDFIKCPADDVGFGGARGGAKSAGIVADWLWHDHEFGEAANGAVFRRERVQLAEFINEASKIFDRVNLSITEPKSPKWKWHHQGQYFESPNGSHLKFVYLDKDADADKHQSGNFTRLYIEERGTFPRERPLNMILGTLRSGRGVPCQQKSTFNPGGVGHSHCKSRYHLFDKFPKGYNIFKSPEGDTRCFIPSKLVDNPHLGEGYIKILRAACAGNEALLNAWLDGDWSVVEGAFFENWSTEHVIAPFNIPNDWLRFRSFKHGSAKPFSSGWWAVVGRDFGIPSLDATGRLSIPGKDNSDDRLLVPGHERGLVLSEPEIFLPKGALIRYREWYGQKNTATNEGLKLNAETIAEGIKARTPAGEEIAYTVANPQIFETKGGPSIAERMMRRGVGMFGADDTKLEKLGYLSGWDALRLRLGDAENPPAIFCFNSCADSVRTIPALQHDRASPEEIDDESETHAADDWRFACMSRPWIPKKFLVPERKFIQVGGSSTVTMDDLWKNHKERKNERV